MAFGSRRSAVLTAAVLAVVVTGVAVTTCIPAQRPDIDKRAPTTSSQQNDRELDEPATQAPSPDEPAGGAPPPKSEAPPPPPPPPPAQTQSAPPPPTSSGSEPGYGYEPAPEPEPQLEQAPSAPAPSSAPAPAPRSESDGASPQPDAARTDNGTAQPADDALGRARGLPGASGGTAAPKEPFDVVPVFFGTDRATLPDPKRLQYGAERGLKLQIGRALVTVPSQHKVPNIERPWVIELPYFKYKIYEEKEDPIKHFTMQEVSALTPEQLLAYVRERLDKSVTFKDHAFVFVHGFNTSFDAAIYRTAQISYDLKFDGVPFVYSWPSGGKVASYTYDRGSAEQAEPHLAKFLELVVKQSGAKSISLIAHSMGNELLLRVLERMRPVVPPGVVISQVILAAPDVDRDKFDNIARQITDFAKGVTLYAASNDRALSYSARFWGGVPRAGDVPATGPLIIPGVDTIDVTAVSTDGLGLNHSGYAENAALLNDIKLLLQAGVRPPEKREPSLLRIESPAVFFGAIHRLLHNARQAAEGFSDQSALRVETINSLSITVP